MAGVAFFGKIQRAIGTAGIIGNALAGGDAGFVGQARTAIYRTAAIVVPDTAQFTQRRTCCRHARRNTLAGGIASLSRSAGAAKKPAAALVGNDAALFSLRRTTLASSRTPGRGFQHLAESVERERRGAIIVLASSRIARKSAGTSPAGGGRLPRSGAANCPIQGIFPILSAGNALTVEPDAVAPAAIACRTANFVVTDRARRASFAGGTGSRCARINRAITAKIFIADKLARSLVASKTLADRQLVILALAVSFGGG